MGFNSGFKGLITYIIESEEYIKYMVRTQLSIIIL